MKIVTYAPLFGGRHRKKLGKRKNQSRFGQTTQSDVIARFVEIKPGLVLLGQAISKVRETKATLVITRLGSRSKSLPFLRQLKESGVLFSALDDTDFGPHSLNSYLKQAEDAWHERSVKIKDGLADAARRGTKLGSNRIGHWTKRNEHKRDWKKASAVAAERRHQRNADAYSSVLPKMKAMRANGETYQAIAEALNEGRHVTTAGARFTASRVCKILKRHGG
jgi:DNA invertase Pin-like site-specific DNA recombinase